MPARKEYNSEGLKQCSKCGEWKDPFAAFGKYKAAWDGLKTECRQCRSSSKRVYYLCNRETIKEQNRKWKLDNKDKIKLDSREYRLKKTYGMTISEFDQMFRTQDGLCAICRQTCRIKNTLSVDHCHRTGTVRGLLCHACNTAIGFLEEDPVTIDNALMYIVKHRMRIQENAK